MWGGHQRKVRMRYTQERSREWEKMDKGEHGQKGRGSASVDHDFWPRGCNTLDHSPLLSPPSSCEEPSIGNG